jgi:hypothetical protein
MSPAAGKRCCLKNFSQTGFENLLYSLSAATYKSIPQAARSGWFAVYHITRFDTETSKLSNHLNLTKMKNLKFILAATLILISSATIKTDGQVAVSDSRTSAREESAGFSNPESGSSVTTNLKASTNFHKDYSLAQDAQWFYFADKSLMCRFYLNNILHRAFYTPHGNWIYTTSGYDGSKLNKAVAERIRSVYFDYRIVYADQIDLVNGKTFYIVEIQDDKSIRKLRVNEDEMDVVQEFAKP